MFTRLTGVFIFLYLCMACTKMEVVEPALPNLPVHPNQLLTRLPVCHLKVDPDSFQRIYQRFRDDIEVPAVLDYYDQNGALIFEAESLALEIKGTSSALYEMKSLGLEFHRNLPNHNGPILNPPGLLKGHALNEIGSIRLRNSGNDFGKSMIKDMAYTQLAVEGQLNLELMYGRAAHVFVNDNYYGLLNLRSENNPRGLAQLLNVDASELTLLRMNGGKLKFDEGDQKLANQLKAAIENRNFEALKLLINRSSFIDYLIFEDYIGNDDWPASNCRLHSINGEAFRFFLFDLDYAAYRSRNPRLPELEYLDDDFSELYRLYLEGDESFEDELHRRRKALYRIFSPRRFNAITDSLAREIELEVPYLIARYQQPESRLHWKLAVAGLKREFERQDYYIRKKYDR